jgi:hypothetical protein
LLRYAYAASVRSVEPKADIDASREFIQIIKIILEQTLCAPPQAC